MRKDWWRRLCAKCGKEPRLWSLPYCRFCVRGEGQ